MSKKSILRKLPLWGLGGFLLLTSCKHTQVAAEESQGLCGPEFVADSAYQYCQRQCDFGPRTMNSDAHQKCLEWIKQKFESFGCTITLQSADLKGWDGTILKSTNIIASIKPEVQNRIMLCAHYDSRPWADNDPDEANHKKPVMAANDGASGVAVMLEVARLMQKADSAGVGVDFICFDAEDYGTPQWAPQQENSEDTWALGAQYWAESVAQGGYRYKPSFGILLDMVGGKDAAFSEEGMSLQFAKPIVQKVWDSANVAGFAGVFPVTEGGYITDDHIPVNKTAKIPCIDIIPFYAATPQNNNTNFGPTWHTVSDTMDNISKETLKAVGQTIIQVIYSE